jgi:hypothetical protein
MRSIEEKSSMSVSRKLGIVVFFAVPGIIGGGIIYHIFDGNYLPVFIYETILLLIAGAYLSK